MLDGGLVARRPYLIVGPSGTGKTTLGLQFLCAGIRNGERALLVTLEEPPNEVRSNHPGLAPELLKVDVFDAIPDVMRYERAPFKDIAAVRSATPFERVPEAIRRTPELTSIEVTITALEQMLRTEVQRHAYSRIVIDSLTALQYFCMKGFDVVAGAQTFLRFLSDLRVTTILTVEAPLEDVETPERMLARGEIRLFRWELDDLTVRAIGVEKLRGSAHDIRLHPYRIGPTGLDINLAVTISRDTRQILETPPLAHEPASGSPFEPIPPTLQVLAEELSDLVLVGADIVPIRTELEAALASARLGDTEHATQRLTRAVALGATLPDRLPAKVAASDSEVALALRRMAARAETGRVGQPPVRVPEPPILTARLAKMLSDLHPPGEAVAVAPIPAPVQIPGPELTVASSTPSPPVAAAPAASVLPVAPSVPTHAPTPSAPPSEAPLTNPPSTSPPPPVPTPTPPMAAPAQPSRVSHGPPPPLPRAVSLPEPAVKPPSGSVPSQPSTAPSVPHVHPAPHVASPGTAVSHSGSPAHITSPAHPAPPTHSAAHPPSAAHGTSPGHHAAPTPAEPVHVPAPTPAAETMVTAPSAAAPAAKKRKRAPSASRKKAAAVTPKEPEAAMPAIPVTPEPVPSIPLDSTAPSAPAPAPEVALAAGPEASAPPRPKRRVVRKKKAPSVVGATPGPPTEEPSPPSTAPPAETPPVERPPEAP